MASDPVLELFSPPVREWFASSFPAPTVPQRLGWPAIAAGDNTLVLAPTGTGKTLTAFLWGIDRLLGTTPPTGEQARTHRTRLIYLSPLRALAVDVEKNLRAPLVGIGHAAARGGHEHHEVTVGVRTGDTAADERRRLVRTPPDLLITTPESLFLMLTSQARSTLAGVEAVIVDEIHALVPTKRGAHLALSLERLEKITDRPFQRIGLSATQRPLDEVARFLGGNDPSSGKPRTVQVVDAGVRKALELEVVVPVEDMGALGEVIDEPVSGPAAAGPQRRSIWPAIHPKLLELVHGHRSTIIFTNARRAAERLAARLNELDLEGVNRGAENDGRGPGDEAELVRAHHGSLSRERRLSVEDQLKSGDLSGLVATSSLELGIDMGAVDLVVQVGSPGSVAAGLQRIGRAGHQVGEPSRGKLFPRHRADLLEVAVVAQRMHEGEIESTRYLRSPLDVLAQQIVAMCALDDWHLDELAGVVRSAAPYAELSDELLTAVLDMLSGRYPAEDFAGLAARVVWDRSAGTLRGRKGAQRLAVTNAGTIPDRGLFGVFLADGTRVGELDEEMVYESRVGETFLLGASAWRIEDITFDRVVVRPAPGEPARMPFWLGDTQGRPIELGRAVGQTVRELRALAPDAALHRLRERHDLDELAARNLLAYLDEQAEATGSVPDDRTIVVERFRDEIGDWRVCILTPFGDRVHAPWAVALRAKLTESWGAPPELLHSDQGIVLRLPEHLDELPLDELLIDPDQLDDLVLTHLPSTALFAARFRECAARALLLPRRRPGQRTPLWQQRQRAADLLAAAAPHPQFPILLEATRECVTEVFDLDALRSVLADVSSRAIGVVTAETERASPFAQSLVFEWIAVFMYEGDAPLAERRAAALSLDRDLLGDLLGSRELRELLDPQVMAELEAWLGRLDERRWARDGDELADLLRELGPLDADALARRCVSGVIDTVWLAGEEQAPPALVGDGVQLMRVAVAGRACLAAVEDAGRLRDGLGVAIPLGLPEVFTESVDDPLGDLVARYARTHGPFTAAEVAAHWGAGIDPVEDRLDHLVANKRLVSGEFRPGGTAAEFCDAGVLRTLRRRSLAALRREIEPVESTALARFALDWHGIGSARRGVDALLEAIAQLQGAAVPASMLETDILAARVGNYDAADLDALFTGGEVLWVGAGAIGPSDGRVRLVLADQAPLLVEPVDRGDPAGALGTDEDDPAVLTRVALRAHLRQRGASRWGDLVASVHEAGLPYDDEAVLGALWDLVWAGELTNDAMAPLRALTLGATRSKRGKGRARRPLSMSATAPLSAVSRRRAAGRPGSGGLRAGGPSAASGRWSLLEPLLEPRPSPTEVAHAHTVALLERHGVLTREAALAEGITGGFAGIYPVLGALEERGLLRRGYFVEGLGAAQFALPGAVDRLRAVRDERERTSARSGAGDETPVVLAADDPAQLYGAALGWPSSAGRPSRSAGARVVLVDGEPCAFLERGGRSLVLFPAAEEHPSWTEALAALVDGARVKRLELTRIDGQPAAESAWAEALRTAGFTDGYRGLVRRVSR